MKIKIGNKDIKFVRIGGEVVYPSYIKDGLVLWYDFSGRGNNDTLKGIAEDLSSNGNDGVLNNFEYDNGSGYEDNGLEFDGVDDAIQGNEALCYDDTDFTMEFVWDIKEETGNQRAIGQFGNGFTHIGYDNSNRFYVNYRRVGGTAGVYSVRFPTNINPYESGSLNFTVLFDNTNLKISAYMNGVEIGRESIDSKLEEEIRLDRATLGRVSSATGIKQSIYSFRKYNRLLTPEEIAQNYKIDKHRFNIQEI